MGAPLREIVTHCGEEPSVVLNQVKQGTGSYGYNAASIAGLMITTEAMVAEAPKKDEPMGGGHGGGGGMGGMGGMDF